MVKSLWFTSKKMLPTASTLIRAVVVLTLGKVTNSDPSFGVLAASTYGKVEPPSVDSEIITLGASSAVFVLLTSQVTVV